MKKIQIILSFLLLTSLVMAQEVEQLSTDRKGQWTIEVGNGFLTNLVGPPSGGGVIFADGGSVTNISINAGKFISNDFALKFNVGLFSLSSGFGSNEVFNLMAGAKYYIGKVAPLDVTAGVLTGGGDAQFNSKATIGYAIPLANNINLEPAAGVLITDGITNGIVQLSFALFF